MRQALDRQESQKWSWPKVISLSFLLVSLPAIKAQTIAVPVANVTASSEIPAPFNRLDDYLVDGSGLSGGAHTPQVQPNMWLSSAIGFGGEDLAPSVAFDLGQVHLIRSIRVWNYNEAPPNLTNRGVNAVTVRYGATPALGEVVAEISSFAQASGQASYAGEVFDSFEPFVARYLEFEIGSNHGDGSNFYGLSEVQFEGEAFRVTISERNFGSSKEQGEVIALLGLTPVLEGETRTFSLIAGEGDTDNNKFEISGEELRIGTHDFSGTPDGEEFSLRVLSTASSGLQDEAVVTLQLFVDQDADDLADSWEEKWSPGDPDLLSGLAGADRDLDGLSDLEEFALSVDFPDLDPTESDSDDDTLNDADELNGAGLRPATDPTRADTDGDNLSDFVESNTSLFSGLLDTGSSPISEDSDGDRFDDGVEVSRGSDPNDASSIPTPLLVGYWDFESDVNPQPDRSEFRNDASVVQGASWVFDSERGGVMEFDGFDSYLEAADSESLSVEGDITIAAWIKVTDFNGFRGIVGKTAGPLGNQPSPYDFYLVQNFGTPRFLSGAATGSGSADGLTIPMIGEWHHLAVTRIGDAVTFYYDGQLDSTGVITRALADSGTPLRIGNRNDLVTDFLGRMDDVVIFDGGLNSDEIMEIRAGDFSSFGVGELELTVTRDGGGLRFEWNSRTGRLYDLVSSADLSSAPENWPVYQGSALYEDLEGTGEILGLENVPLDGATRFFAIVEKNP